MSGVSLLFLRQHRHLISVLQEGRPVVKVFFGEETPVNLQMQRDPEAGIDLLNAWIQTDLPADEAVERLLEFGDAWFCDQLEFVGELLNFNLGVKA